MKKICCWILMLCVACCCSAAMAEDEWTCPNCDREVFGNFCWNCGAAKPDEEMWQCPSCGEYVQGAFCTNCTANGLNGDILTYYYIQSVYQDLDIPYLTNLMRWRDGKEETSSLAVFVRDPDSDNVGMFTDANIISDGCNYTWQCRDTRYHVLMNISSIPEEGPCIVNFYPSDEEAVAEILESAYIPEAAIPHDKEELTLCYYVLDESEEVLRKASCSVIVDGYQDFGNYQQILFSFQDGNDKLTISDANGLFQGIQGVLINEDDCLCGVVVNGFGAMSFLQIDDEAFYTGAEKSSEEPDFEKYAELLYTYSASGLSVLDWDNVSGWTEQSRTYMSLNMIYTLVSEEAYSGEIAFDWENMYSGTMRFESGHKEFVLFAADGSDVLLFKWSTGSLGHVVNCYRLIDADPSDMLAAIEDFEQSSSGAGITLSLTQNSYEMMEEYANIFFGEEMKHSESEAVPLTMHAYSEEVLGIYIGYDSISVNDARQVQYNYRKYEREENVEGAKALCDSYADYLEHDCGFTRVHEGNKGKYHYEYILRKTAGDAQYQITLDFWCNSGAMGGWITASYNDDFAALYPELTGNSAAADIPSGKEKCSNCMGSGNCTVCGGSGRVRKLLAGTTEWVEQDCTSCRPVGSGNCSFCGGAGYR